MSTEDIFTLALAAFFSIYGVAAVAVFSVALGTLAFVSILAVIVERKGRDDNGGR